MKELCPCGKPLHYSDPIVEKKVRSIIAGVGERVKVTTPDGCWLVPRHYIALHGLKASELPSSNFERVRSMTPARSSVTKLREIRAVQQALRANVRRGYMLEVEPDRFKLTTAGEEYVLGMFERGSGRGVTKYGRLR